MGATHQIWTGVSEEQVSGRCATRQSTAAKLASLLPNLGLRHLVQGSHLVRVPCVIHNRGFFGTSLGASQYWTGQLSRGRQEFIPLGQADVLLPLLPLEQEIQDRQKEGLLCSGHNCFMECNCHRIGCQWHTSVTQGQDKERRALSIAVSQGGWMLLFCAQTGAPSVQIFHMPIEVCCGPLSPPTSGPHHGHHLLWWGAHLAGCSLPS